MTRKQRILVLCASAAAALAAVLAGTAPASQPAGIVTVADHHPLRAEPESGAPVRGDQ
ncbi:hypothetical protein [Streptomyces specialis]|uniref:hypothetical protein n=1 Tax=Streptomyces specialis TaxID=498367 RepID=UPI000A826D49|nr:hypothetical protein [Streptomyces specialis]